LRDIYSLIQRTLPGSAYPIITQNSTGDANIFDSNLSLLSGITYQPVISILNSGKITLNNCDINGTAFIPDGEGSGIITGGFAIAVPNPINSDISILLSRISGNVTHNGDGFIRSEYSTFTSISAVVLGGIPCINNNSNASLNLRNCNFATDFLQYAISSASGLFYDNTFERDLLTGIIPTFDYSAFSGIVDFGGSGPQNTVGFSTLSRRGEAFPTSGGVAAVQANDPFVTRGDAQTSQIVAKAVTTDGNPVNLEVINNVGLSVSPFEILLGKTYAVTMTLVGRRTGGASVTDSYQAEISFLIVRDLTNPPLQIGSTSINNINISPAPGFTNPVIPLVPPYTILLPVLGLADETWRWVARINYIEVSE
jgi:hypothetical protein